MRKCNWMSPYVAIAAAVMFAACSDGSSNPRDSREQGTAIPAESAVLSECGTVGWLADGGQFRLYPVQKIGVDADFPERFAPSIPLAEDSFSEFCVEPRDQSMSLNSATVSASSNDSAVLESLGFSDGRLRLAAKSAGSATLTVTTNGVTDTWSVETSAVSDWNVQLLEQGTFSNRASEAICGAQGGGEVEHAEGAVMGTPLHIIHYARSVDGSRLLGFRGEARVAVEEYAGDGIFSILSSIPKNGWYHMVLGVSFGGGSNYRPPDRIRLVSQTEPTGLTPTYGLAPRPDSLGASIEGRDGTRITCAIFPDFGGSRCQYLASESEGGDAAGAFERFDIELVPAHGQTCLIEMSGCEYEVDVEVSDTGAADPVAIVRDHCLDGGRQRCESGACTVTVSERFELEIPPASRADLTARNRAVIPSLTEDSQPVTYDVVERIIVIEAR